MYAAAAIDANLGANSIVDTHHIQVHRPEALGFKDKEARKVRREAGGEACRQVEDIVAPTTIEPPGSHSDIRVEDI